MVSQAGAAGVTKTPFLAWLRTASFIIGGRAMLRRQLNVFHWNGNVTENQHDSEPAVSREASSQPTAFQGFGSWRAATIRDFDPVTCQFELKYHDEPKRSKAYLWLPLAVAHYARNPPPSFAAIRPFPDAPSCTLQAASLQQLQDQDLPMLLASPAEGPCTQASPSPSSSWHSAISAQGRQGSFTAGRALHGGSPDVPFRSTCSSSSSLQFNPGVPSGPGSCLEHPSGHLERGITHDGRSVVATIADALQTRTVSRPWGDPAGGMAFKAVHDTSGACDGCGGVGGVPLLCPQATALRTGSYDYAGHAASPAPGISAAPALHPQLQRLSASSSLASQDSVASTALGLSRFGSSLGAATGWSSPQQPPPVWSSAASAGLAVAPNGTAAAAVISVDMAGAGDIGWNVHAGTRQQAEWRSGPWAPSAAAPSTMPQSAPSSNSHDLYGSSPAASTWSAPSAPSAPGAPSASLRGTELPSAPASQASFTSSQIGQEQVQQQLQPRPQQPGNGLFSSSQFQPYVPAHSKRIAADLQAPTRGSFGTGLAAGPQAGAAPRPTEADDAASLSELLREWMDATDDGDCELMSECWALPPPAKRAMLGYMA